MPEVVSSTPGVPTLRVLKDRGEIAVKYGKHSIRYLGPHIWGKIGQELRSKTSLQAFRRGVRALNVLSLLDGKCGCCACSS